MQKKRHSLIEALVSTGVGYGIGFTTQIVSFHLLGIPVSLAQNILLGIIFTFVSVARGYGIRRLFNWLSVKGILK
jgi:hypothetical protein